MNLLMTALEFDQDDRPVEAADAYEEVLRECPGDRDTIVNLIGIYFAALDGGYSARHHLSQEFIERSDKRFHALLNQGLMFLPQDTELDFWKRYYAVRVLGENWDEVFPAAYEHIVVQGHQLAPYLALFLSSAGMKYETELRQLLVATSQGQTQRERELKSVAESATRLSAQKMGSPRKRA